MTRHLSFAKKRMRVGERMPEKPQSASTNVFVVYDSVKARLIKAS